AVHDVRRVDVDDHRARPRQRPQRLDDGGELHTVVRRGLLAAEQLLLVLAEPQQRTPAAQSRFALAGAVGPHLDGALEGRRHLVRLHGAAVGHGLTLTVSVVPRSVAGRRRTIPSTTLGGTV